MKIQLFTIGTLRLMRSLSDCCSWARFILVTMVATWVLLTFGSPHSLALDAKNEIKIEQIELQSSGRQSLTPHLYVLRDPSKKLGLKDVVALLAVKDGGWKKLKNSNLKATDDFVWMGIVVANRSDQTLTRTLTWRSFALDKATIYENTPHSAGNTQDLAHSKEWSVSQRGREVHASQRGKWGPIDGHRFTIGPHETREIFMLVHSNYDTRAELTLHDEESLSHHVNLTLAFHFFYIGLILALIAYNLALFFTLREYVNLVYAIYSGILLYTVELLNGVLEYSSQGSIGNELVILPSLHSIVVFVSILFARVFLSIERSTPLVGKLFDSLLVVSLVIAVLQPIVPVELSGVMRTIAMLLSLIGLTFGAIVRARQGFRPATLFLAGWTPFFLGVIVWQLALYGFLPDNFWTTNATSIGSLVEMLTFSIAISFRFHQLRQDVLDSLEQKNTALRSELVNAAKLSSLGEMAGGIAHEINNPLAIITGRCLQLKTQIALSPLEDEVKTKTEAMILSIENTAFRIAAIVTGLRAFARKSEKDPFADESLMQVIEDTLSFCRSRFQSADIDLRVLRREQSTIMVRCRSVQLSQVLLNLLNNACDAVESLNERWVEVEVVQKTSTVELRVTDSGRGIPSEISEKMMNPFFTTKAVGKGTGLGLSISLGIVHEHGGSITLDRMCPNTRFVVTLPCLQADQVQTS